MPKVSVVIPTYNRTEFLSSAILSVLNQTYQDFEIIIVDDGSTDNTIDVITALNSKKIKYIRHEYNKGEAGTRNTGILNSNGQYIAFLDDDDEWLPEKLELQVNKIENSLQQIGLIYTGLLCCHYIENKLFYQWQYIPLHKGNTYHTLMKKNFIYTPSSVLIRRRCLEQIGLFNSEIAYGLDYDYWIRISKHFDFEYLTEPLVRYRLHENGLSNNNELRAMGARDLAMKYGKQIIANNYWRSVYLHLGIELCRKGEMKKGVDALSRSIRYYPTHKRSRFYFNISLLGLINFKWALVLKNKLRPYFLNRKLEKLFCNGDNFL
jgi:glycosyltransferase involved in cell wall biosynthesis